MIQLELRVHRSNVVDEIWCGQACCTCSRVKSELHRTNDSLDKALLFWWSCFFLIKKEKLNVAPLIWKFMFNCILKTNILNFLVPPLCQSGIIRSMFVFLQLELDLMLVFSSLILVSSVLWGDCRFRIN